MPDDKYMEWQAFCTPAASLESQGVQTTQVGPFPREVRGSGFAGHLQVDFWVILVALGAENATHTPLYLPDCPRRRQRPWHLGPGVQPDKYLSGRDGKNIMWCSANCRQQFSWCSGCWILKLVWKNNLPSIYKAVSLWNSQAVILSASPGCFFLR